MEMFFLRIKKLFLAENLCDFFRDRELEKRSLKANIDITSADNLYLFKQVK